MKPYLAQIRSNVRLMLRDRSVLFFSLMFPAVFFFVFANVYEAKNNPAQMAKVIAMVLLIGVLGNGFFGAGLRTVGRTRNQHPAPLQSRPGRPAPIIVASMVAGLVAYLPTLALFLIVAKVWYNDPLPSNVVSLTLFVMIGLVAFRAMGMIIAAVVNSAQEATILIQILYLPMLFLSGATFPVSFMPQWVQNIAHFLPATYLHEGIEAILIKQPEQSIIDNWQSVLGLLITTAVALLVGIKLSAGKRKRRFPDAPSCGLWPFLCPLSSWALIRPGHKTTSTRRIFWIINPRASVPCFSSTRAFSSVMAR